MEQPTSPEQEKNMKKAKQPRIPKAKKEPRVGKTRPFIRLGALFESKKAQKAVQSAAAPCAAGSETAALPEAQTPERPRKKSLFDALFNSVGNVTTTAERVSFNEKLADRIRRQRLGAQVILRSAIIIVLVMGVSFVGIYNLSQSSSNNNGKLQMQGLARQNAQTVRLWLDAQMSVARTLAQAMEGYGGIPFEMRRPLYNSLMKTMLEANPELVGIWTCWELNALDSMDFNMQNTFGTDGSGRFLPYWSKVSGEITATPLENYKTKSTGAYFWLAKDSGEETILEPYKKSVNNWERLVTTLAVPVRGENGLVVAVTGLDFPLSTLQTAIYNHGEYRTAQFYVLSAEGSIVVAPTPDFVGKSLSEIGIKNASSLLDAVKAGSEKTVSVKDPISGRPMQLFIMPFTVGNTSTPWSVAIAVEDSEILKDSRSINIMVIAIFALLTLITSLTVYATVRSLVTKPVTATVALAHALAAGNLDTPVSITSENEIGMLARVLDEDVRGAFKSIEKARNISQKQADYQSKQVDKLIIDLEKLSRGELSCEVSVDEADEDTEALHTLFGGIAENLKTGVSAIKGYIEEISNVLVQMAGGNLDVEITSVYMGDFALLKTSLNDIVDNLNATMRNIGFAADQVASGTHQVSSGSQVISQGSTMQASAIEQLTASISEIAGQTSQNAVSANRASELSFAAQNDAREGKAQMDKMMDAMQDITSASEAISKIIRVIDEIAFQTNILALNAAVEAAHAGAHGRGFSVVADEVRNLAAKSAAAARETSTLIDNSKQKAAAGTKMALDTAEELDSILTGIESTASIVAKIAAASSEQATGLAEIAQGITSLTQVVQSNTATAEEAAATSEELSGQADMLKRMVAEVNLKPTE